jgi:HSP20 family protein
MAPWGLANDFASDISQMQREMNRLMDTFFRGDVAPESEFASFLIPAVDISETDDNYVVEAELPGLTKEDVKISVKGNILTIRGEKKQEKNETRKNLQRNERCYGTFMRSFTLPSHVEADNIEAEFKDGILSITLPKIEEVKPKSIEVKVK